MEISYLNIAYLKCIGFKCVAQWNVTKWTHPFKQLTAQNIKITGSPLTYLSVTASSFLSGNKQYSDFNHYRLIIPLHDLIYLELNSKFLLFHIWLFKNMFAMCLSGVHCLTLVYGIWLYWYATNLLSFVMFVEI